MPRLKTIGKLFVWEVVNPLLLHARRGRLRLWNEAFRGLNLGCGLDLPPQWIGIDGGPSMLLRYLPSFLLRRTFTSLNMSRVYRYEDYVAKLRTLNVIHHDLRSSIPFSSNTVPNIYSSHFLEHLSLGDATRLLHECFRVLRPGGMIRIAVPSLDHEVDRIRTAVSLYERGNTAPVLTYLLGEPGFRNSFSVHRCLYDFEQLRSLLLSAGFDDVVECGYRTGAIVDVELLDTRKESLFVEAIKRAIF